MTDFTHYRALLAPVDIRALTPVQLSAVYSHLAGAIDGMLGHNLPGYPIPIDGDFFNRDWYTRMRDYCTTTAVTLQGSPAVNGSPTEVNYLNTCRNDVPQLTKTLRHLFSRLHGSWKLDALLRDVRNLARLQGQSDRHGWLRDLRDYGDCMDSPKRVLRCQCFAAATFNTAQDFGNPLDLRMAAIALQPRPISAPVEQGAVNDLSTVCALLSLNWDSVQHQLRTYATVLNQLGSPRGALQNGNFTWLARHTNAAISLLAAFDEEQPGASTLGRELGRAVIRTQCTWFRSIVMVNGQLIFDLSDLAHQFRAGLPHGGAPYIGPVPRLYVEDLQLERVDHTIFLQWCDALVDDPTEPAELDEEEGDEDDDDFDYSGPPLPRPPPPPSRTRAQWVAYAEQDLARTLEFLREGERNPPFERSSPFGHNYRWPHRR